MDRNFPTTCLIVVALLATRVNAADRDKGIATRHPSANRAPTYFHVVPAPQPHMERTQPGYQRRTSEPSEDEAEEEGESQIVPRDVVIGGRNSDLLDGLDDQPPNGVRTPLRDPPKGAARAKPRAKSRSAPPPVMYDEADDADLPVKTKSIPRVHDRVAPPQGSSAAETSNLTLEEKVDRLEKKLQACLGYHSRRLDTAANRTPWDLMHIALPFGVDSQIVVGGKKVNTLSWLCINGDSKGPKLLTGNNGELTARVVRGAQGLPGQFLAVLAQSQVSGRYPIRADGSAFKVFDLVEYEKATVQSEGELSYKLIGLSHYLDCDAQWRNSAGETWSVSRMLREEINRPLPSASCGGTHRMMGISYALRVRALRGEPINGEWLRAQKYQEQVQNYLLKLQNADGSFSTRFFEDRDDDPDLNKRLHSTGHLLEWLVFSLPREQLLDARVLRGTEYMVDMLLQYPDQEWEYGHRGHALRALAVFHNRVFEEDASDVESLETVVARE